MINIIFNQCYFSFNYFFFIFVINFAGLVNTLHGVAVLTKAQYIQLEQRWFRYSYWPRRWPTGFLQPILSGKFYRGNVITIMKLNLFRNKLLHLLIYIGIVYNIILTIKFWRGIFTNVKYICYAKNILKSIYFYNTAPLILLLLILTWPYDYMYYLKFKVLNIHRIFLSSNFVLAPIA